MFMKTDTQRDKNDGIREEYNIFYRNWKMDWEAGNYLISEMNNQVSYTFFVISLIKASVFLLRFGLSSFVLLIFFSSLRK